MQGLGQAGELVPGVGPLAGGHGLVGPEDEAQVGQLLPLRPAGLLPRPAQLLRGYTAALQLVRCGNKAGEKGGLAGGALVDLQLAGYRPQGAVHEQQPPSRVQCGGGQPAVGGEHPVGQAGKGEHLGIQAHRAASRPTQLPLHVVGVLLGHQEDLLPAPLPRRHGAEQGGCLPGARPAQQQLEHLPRLLSLHTLSNIISHTPRLWKQPASGADCIRIA